jgi:intein/homing endonuclease
MISYLTEGGDMHRDAGVDVWMLPANEITKLIRFFLKNQYVFPEFYGSIFANCARGLWETSINLPTTSGEPLREHMRVKGIKTLNEFTEHLKDCENKLWHRFRVYKKWKDNQEIIFRQQGFIETFLGFKYTDYMGYNELSNYPVQGCLQGSSRVLTSNGLVPIKDLVGKVVKVWTGFKWADAVGLNRGRCQLATIWLSSGLKINCDTRHKLKTEKNKWVDFENLKVGDYVALPKNIHPIKPSSNMTWEFVFGYIIGDGILGLRKNGRKYLSMVGGEKKLNLLVKMKEFLENKGLKVRTRIQTYDNPKHKPVFSISVENKRFNRFLEKKGFVFGWKSHTKEIPNCIWHSTAQQQRDFMEGLWLSDGSRNKDHEKNLHMCNRKLLSQVQILISSLGYDSKLPIEESKSYLLSVNWREFNSKSTRRFPRNVLDRAVDFIDKTNYQVENEWITDKRNFNKVQNVTQYVAERIIEKNGDPNFEIYRYDTIEKIEIHEKHEDTYTMSVQDDLHQFVADGVIHRNTAFHVLLWTYIQVNKRRKEEEWRTVIPAEIHDSMVFDFAPKEVDHIIKTVKHIAEVETRKHFEWINIPIKIEAELAPVGASWYDIKPYEVKA